MNKLDAKARAQILHLLCEGSSIRAVTRLTGASKNTVAKLLVDVGTACLDYQDKAFRNLLGFLSSFPQKHRIAFTTLPPRL